MSQIIFSVVGKRHHTRIFSINKKQDDKNGNCLVGTVVDKKSHIPHLMTFTISAYYANQGTARSSHYTIHHDDT